MKKVLLITQSLDSAKDPSGWITHQVLQGLNSPDHEVRVLSGEDQKEFCEQWPQRFSFNFPMKSWNILEAAKLLPHLIDFRPDRIHCVEGPKKSSWTKLDLLSHLPQFMKGIRPSPLFAHRWDMSGPKGSLEAFDQVYDHSSLWDQNASSFPLWAWTQPLDFWQIEKDELLTVLPGPLETHIDFAKTQDWALEYLRENPEQRLRLDICWSSFSPIQRNTWLEPFRRQGLDQRLEFSLSDRLEDLQKNWASAGRLAFAPLKTNQFFAQFALWLGSIKQAQILDAPAVDQKLLDLSPEAMLDRVANRLARA